MLQKTIINNLNKKSLNISTEILMALKSGKIKVSFECDSCWDFESLAGDLFCEKTNQDIDPEMLLRQKKAFKQRINQSGVNAVIASYWNGREWTEENLIDNHMTGFIGNDFFGSGYENDLLSEAFEEYRKQQLDCDGFVIDPYKLHTNFQ